MKKWLFPLLAAASAVCGANVEIPERPGKVTDTIAIFPEQQVQYGTFQNFLHYWNDRPLYLNRAHRYPGTKFVYNNDASLNVDIEIARRYGIAGLCPLSNYRTIKLMLDAADNHYHDDFRVLPGVYPPRGNHPDKVAYDEKHNFQKAVEIAIASKSTWRINGKAVINSYEATLITPKVLKAMLDEAHKKFGDTFLFSACMKIPGQQLYARFQKNGRKLKASDIQWYTDTVQSYLDVCDGLYLYGMGRVYDHDGEYGSRIDAEFFWKHYRPIVWKIMNDPRNKGKIFGILCGLGYVNPHSARVNASERGSETLRECFEECLSLNPDYIVPFEWNEWNENTCFMPTIYKGSGIERLMIFLNSKITKKPLVPRKGDDLTLPNVILSYRYQLKLGEILRFEFLTLPDGSPAFEGEAKLQLRDLSGKVVKSFPFHFRNGDYKAQTVEISSETLAQYQVLVPELRLTDRNGKERLIANMLYIRLLPSYNDMYQYVRHVVRDDAPVKAEWSVEPDGDGYLVSGKVASEEELRHVELLDNRDEMRAVEDAPEFDQNQEIVIRVGMTSRPPVHLAGTMRILEAGKVKVRGAFNDGNREFFGYDTLADGLKLNGAAIGKNYREALFAIDKNTAEKAVFVADLKQGKFSFPVKKLLKNGGRYAVELSEKYFFQFDIAQNQIDIPLKLTGKEAKFSFHVKSRNHFPVFSLRVLTESGKVWHSLPVAPKKLSPGTAKLDVYSETKRKAVKVDIAKDRIVDLDYRFSPANGAMMMAAGRPDFVATLGGAYHSGSALCYERGLPAKPAGFAPRWMQDDDKSYFLRFDGNAQYAALPMCAFPSGAFTLEMELRPAAENEMVIFRTQGEYPINSFSLLSRWGMLRAGWCDAEGNVQTFPTKLELKTNEWNKVTVRYDLHDLVIGCNGKSQSFPLTLRQQLFSPSCFGGHISPYGIPVGKPEFFKGDLRKLRIIQQ